ncbi:hypothetical protein Cni_G19117 [Canna indica]|uniref:Uncharacterized protein n=1 Tax=Canna indica TaxID=4628 RepID=A0AAQ3KK94_9LILI|nr:hypothetical protein Cni_G19117 [Canna indica]
MESNAAAEEAVLLHGDFLMCLSIHTGSKSTKFSVTVRNDLNVILSEGGGIQRDNPFIHSLKRTVSWVGRKTSDESENREEYHLSGNDGNYLS